MCTMQSAQCSWAPLLYAQPRHYGDSSPEHTHGAVPVVTPRMAPPAWLHRLQAKVTAICAKDDDTLLKPNAASPPPLPPVPVCITVKLDPDAAKAALAAVPRLQRKHYEMIPKSLDEMSFWMSTSERRTGFLRR